MSRRFLYFINPISGTSKKETLRDMISTRTTKLNIPFEIMNTDKTGNYRFLPKKIFKEGITDVIVCGGDGTVNAVASHLKGLNVNIGIIPMGSGNGLALTAGIPKAHSKALRIIFNGEASAVDAFYINDQFSCMLCGIGFDAQVAHDFAKATRRGLQTYIRISAVNFFKARPYPFFVRTKNKAFATDAFFISVANSNQFGNNFTIAPRASLNDGLLDIVIMKKMNKLTLPFSLVSQITGINALQTVENNSRKNGVIYFQTDELVIENPMNAPLHIDGEPVATSKEFKIRVIPNAFRLLQPSSG